MTNLSQSITIRDRLKVSPNGRARKVPIAECPRCHQDVDLKAVKLSKDAPADAERTLVYKSHHDDVGRAACPTADMTPMEAVVWIKRTRERLGPLSDPSNIMQRTGDQQFFAQAAAELARARAKWKPINSAHEGYAVMLEELEEFWEEVKKKPRDRNAGDMYDELLQLAAMAARTAVDVVLFYDEASHDAQAVTG